ncbi:MAG: DUF1684 domain-containing protein [Chitinophagaceae bacterium]
MKYILFLVMIINLHCLAQNYTAQLAAHRKAYAAEFLKDKDAPLKEEDLKWLRFYAADSTYRVTAKAEILAASPNFTIPTYTGAGSEYTRYAVLHFTLKGKPITLTVYKSIALSKNPEYANYLFLPFTDNTNGTTTYAGGRYIDLKTEDFTSSQVVIDFNKAYNPYCAYGAGYNCPKPPDENKLDIKLEAGEKIFGRAIKH